jgi:hypothetical protein
LGSKFSHFLGFCWFRLGFCWFRLGFDFNARKTRLFAEQSHCARLLLSSEGDLDVHRFRERDSLAPARSLEALKLMKRLKEAPL